MEKQFLYGRRKNVLYTILERSAMEYIHNRYNALVKVDENGKKTIHKYGFTFRTFNELFEYERTIDKKQETRNYK